MTAKLDIKIDKSQFNEINELSKQLKNSKDFLREIGEVVCEDIKHRLVALKSDPDDKPWQPWAKSTEKARQKDGTAALGLLFKTGALTQSITYQLTSNNRLQVGTNNRYAGFLNDGTNNMPARPFMGLSKRASAGIDEVLKLHFGANK